MVSLSGRIMITSLRRDSIRVHRLRTVFLSLHVHFTSCWPGFGISWSFCLGTGVLRGRSHHRGAWLVAHGAEPPIQYRRGMGTKEWVKTGLLSSLLAVCLVLGLLFNKLSPTAVYLTRCECKPDNLPNSVMSDSTELFPSFLAPPLEMYAQQAESRTSQHSQLRQLRPKYLSYQPPGNGWNNQRIVLENALVLAKLLNRTLVVHPLSPHELGNRLKQRYHFGYTAYNAINASDLLPLSNFLNLSLLSKLVPIIEVNTSHPQFRRDFSNMTWKGICHSPGYGFWVDEVPQWAEEVQQLSAQKFFSLGRVWRERCKEERGRYEIYRRTESLSEVASSPMVRFVSDLAKEKAEMLYFEEGTLFGIQIRFLTYERALAAQHWVVDHVHYNYAVWERVGAVMARLGGQNKYNAIQVRRGDHMDRKLGQSFWIERMNEKNFSKEMPVYVATNNADPLWFQPFVDEGFKLYFSVNFTDTFSFNDIKETLRSDYLGIHEQCLCEAALHFIPSPASTFNAFILRQRGEVRERDGLMMDTLHTYWIRHQSKDET